MGAPNLRFFLGRVAAAAKDAPVQEQQRAHRLLAIAGLQGVVTRTPVDTGRARANWQASNGAPVLDQLDTTDAGKALSQGRGVIDQAPKFATTYITNNLDYIQFLEEGSSSQAPQGMVAVTIEELQSIDLDQRSAPDVFEDIG